MNNKHHRIHYLILFVIMLTALVLFMLFRYHPVRQFVVVVAASLSYIAWGIIHHAFEDRVDAGIIMEYVLIGVVVILGFWITLLR